MTTTAKPNRPPPDMWLIARTPRSRPYPCRCWLGKACRTTDGHPGYICTCWGRTDLDNVPRHCCARRAASTLETK